LTLARAAGWWNLVEPVPAEASPMTAREYLNRRLRKLGFVYYTGGGLFLGGILIGGILGQQQFMVLCLPGFAITMLAALSHFIWIRCPECRGGLSQLVIQWNLRSVHHRIGYCPYCGIALDDEMAPATAADEPERVGE
jgi:hypothetical protein